mmetsp:Transcript_37418/g.81759  ORF Transcript_37418/g.81759 Transcript_37418/m.81759 type:complete len:238 (-) Transcript_37418:633-1346(-)
MLAHGCLSGHIEEKTPAEPRGAASLCTLGPVLRRNLGCCLGALSRLWKRIKSRHFRKHWTFDLVQIIPQHSNTNIIQLRYRAVCERLLCLHVEAEVVVLWRCAAVAGVQDPQRPLQGRDRSRRREGHDLPIRKLKRRFLGGRTMTHTPPHAGGVPGQPSRHVLRPSDLQQGRAFRDLHDGFCRFEVLSNVVQRSFSKILAALTLLLVVQQIRPGVLHLLVRVLDPGGRSNNALLLLG